MRRLVAAVTAIALAPGCAAIFHGTSETIHVRSEIPDTTFYAGAQEIGKGSDAVTSIEKKALKKTTLRAEKPNCYAKTTPLLTSFDGISLLGILLDLGLISVLVVDGAATGAWTHAKQTDYILTPDCSAAAVPVPSSAAAGAAGRAPMKETTIEPVVRPPSTPPTATVVETVVRPPATAPSPTASGDTGPVRVHSNHIKIVTDPGGAEIFLGGTSLGKTSLEGVLVDLPRGETVFRVQKAGYNSVEKRVLVDDQVSETGEAVVVVIRLVPSSARP
jgi:hypothetical protein